MKKIEFHVHSNASKDSILSKFFIIIMCKLKKIDCLVITDHNEIKFAKKNIEYFKKKNIDIIVGEEIFTRDGEIIGLFLNEKIEPGLSAVETVKSIKKQDGMVYIPHPYDEKRSKTVLKTEALELIINEIDFIEIHNGRNVKDKYSEEQNRIAGKYNLRKIVGSDAHTFYEIGRNYCLVESYEKDSLKNSIDNGNFSIKRCIKIAHYNTKFAKLVKMLLKGDIYGIIRTIGRKIKGRK